MTPASLPHSREAQISQGPMTKLEALLFRLKQAQRELLHSAAEVDALPADGALRRIASLELAIGATEALVEEESRGR